MAQLLLLLLQEDCSAALQPRPPPSRSRLARLPQLLHPQQDCLASHSLLRQHRQVVCLDNLPLPQRQEGECLDSQLSRQHRRREGSASAAGLAHRHQRLSLRWECLGEQRHSSPSSFVSGAWPRDRTTLTRLPLRTTQRQPACTRRRTSTSRPDTLKARQVQRPAGPHQERHRGHRVSSPSGPAKLPAKAGEQGDAADGVLLGLMAARRYGHRFRLRTRFRRRR